MILLSMISLRYNKLNTIVVACSHYVLWLNSEKNTKQCWYKSHNYGNETVLCANYQTDCYHKVATLLLLSVIALVLTKFEFAHKFCIRFIFLQLYIFSTSKLVGI